MKVLIADDEVTICKRLKRELEKEGQEVYYEISSGYVLKRLRKARREKKPFDLLLLNVHMPKVDGLTLLSFIREERLDIEVIIMTGYREEQIVIDAMRLCARNYPNKPISLE